MPIDFTHQSARFDCAAYRGLQRGIGPYCDVASKGWTDCQALPQMSPGLFGFGFKLFKVRPRCLRVDMVRRDGRDAAPVIDAGANELRQRAVAQVRRRLDCHVRPQNQPRRGNRPQMIFKRWFGSHCHQCRIFGAEILDDDFLNMPVLGVKIADREQSFHPFQPRFANSDQQPGGERDFCATCQAYRFQPRRWLFIRRAIMRHALFTEPVRSALDH